MIVLNVFGTKYKSNFMTQYNIFCDLFPHKGSRDRNSWSYISSCLILCKLLLLVRGEPRLSLHATLIHLLGDFFGDFDRSRFLSLALAGLDDASSDSLCILSTS